MRQLIRQLPRKQLVVIFDSKHTWPIRPKFGGDKQQKALPRLLDSTRLLRLRGLKPACYVFRPEYPEISDPRTTAILLYCLHRGDCTVIIDELGDFSKIGNVHPALGKIIRQGREKRVRMMIGTQRPAAIPLIAITESTKIACFRLRSLNDRKRMAEWVDPLMLSELAGHDFWWKDDKKRDQGTILIKQGGRPNEQKS